jgi:hypothetical protein
MKTLPGESERISYCVDALKRIERGTRGILVKPMLSKSDWSASIPELSGIAGWKICS